MRLQHQALSPSFLLIGALNSAALAQICYYPDGSVPTDYAYVPCTSDAISNCCIPSEGDVCLSNGLCQYGASSTYYFRGACTDKNWTSGGGCVDYCASTNSGDWEKLVRCSDTQYCCIHSTTAANCCDTPSLIFNVQFPASIIQTYGSSTTGVPTGTSSSATSASTSKASSATGSSATYASGSSKPVAQPEGTSTGSSSAPTSTPSSTTNILPIAVGAAVGGVVLIGAIVIGAIILCCIRKKRAQRTAATSPPITATYSPLPPQLQPQQTQPQQWGSPYPSPGPMGMGTGMINGQFKQGAMYPPQIAPAVYGNPAEIGGGEVQKNYFGQQNVYEAPS